MHCAFVLLCFCQTHHHHRIISRRSRFAAAEFLSLLLLFLCPFVHRSAAAVAFPEGARDSLPKATWVLLAEGNRTALTVDAFRHTKTQAKLERIERMMNNSLQHNEQSLKKGADALQRLATKENGAGGPKAQNGAATNTANIAGKLIAAMASGILMPILFSNCWILSFGLFHSVKAINC